MKAVNLFSGIGGFEVGLSKSSIATVATSEILEPAIAVLAKRFPDIPQLGDISLIKSLPTCDIVTAGFPCQDLSSSGAKEGISGKRSGLIHDAFRLISKTKPQWVIIENVKFMLYLQQGESIRIITEELNRLGYNWAYRTFNTQWFGLPHRRERVYVVASLDHNPANFLFSKISKEKSGLKITESYGFYWTEGQYSTGLCMGGVPPLKGGSTIGIPSPPALLLKTGQIGTPDIRDAEKLQGFPVDWTKPSEVVAKPSARWKLVGNAVTTRIPKWLGERIQNQQSGRIVASSFPLECTHTVDKKWPLCAFKIKGSKMMTVTPPDETLSSNIDSFLRYPLKPLSEKALTGFLKRANLGNLKYPESFLQRLDNELQSLKQNR